MAALVALICAFSNAAPLPASVLTRTCQALEMGRADIPAMQTPADEAAARLAGGGALWVAGQPSMASELCGRAGGLMMARPWHGETPAPGDVVLYVPEPGVDLPALKETKALIMAIGPSKEPLAAFSVSNHATENGLSPTAANAIPGWVFCGELVAALTRLGKMPVIYESIGVYTGYERIQKYKSGQIPFHDDIPVPPPVAPGVIGNAYIDAVSAMLKRIETEEHANIEKTGQWAREAHAQGKHLFMYSLGHIFPDEVAKTDIGRLFKSAVWCAGFSHVPAPEDTYAEGDVAVLIGYQHPAGALLRRARPAKAKVAYVSLFADRDFAGDPDVVWTDPMWNWPDGCVEIKGYDAPLLPASGVVNAAIAWEIYRCAKI